MCPKGHSLLLGSDSVFGRWRWAAHARRCSACAEVRAAARFVEAFAARAGRWPVAGEAVRVRGTRRAWKLAGAVAVIALLLPLGGMVVWRHGRGRFHNPPAMAERTWQVEVTTPEGRSIRTVRFILKQRFPGAGALQGEREQAISFAIQYPDKMRTETSGVSVYTRNGDRGLNVYPDGSQPFPPCHYGLSRPQAPLPSPDVFGEAGVVRAGFVTVQATRAFPYWMNDPRRGEDVLTRHWEAGANGERVLVTKHTKAGDPSFHGTYRTRIDPVSHLVLGWDNIITQRLKGIEGPHGPDETEDVQEEVVDTVEYNLDLPPETFDVTVPPNTSPADVLDGYSPGGLKRIYDAVLATMAEEFSRPPAPKPEVRENALRWWSTQFPRLDVLSPADREEIRRKGREIGLEIP